MVLVLWRIDGHRATKKNQYGAMPHGATKGKQEVAH